MLSGVLAVVTVAALLPLAPAAAQDATDPRAAAQVHLGPVYMTPRLAVREFGVDTNVFNNADAKRDFTTTLAPHADLWVPFGRRGLLTTGATLDLVYYQTYASERSVNPDVSLRGDLFLNRIAPFAEATYLNSRQRPNFEIDVRSRREERALRAGVGVHVGPKLSFELAARRGDVVYDADAVYNDTNLRETLNRRSGSASASVRYAVTPLTTIVVRAEGGNDRFALSPLRDSDSMRVMPGVEFKPLALISGSAFVGVRRFTPLSTGLEPFHGTVANAALNYTLLGSTRFTVTAERDVTYSYERLQPYFVVDGYGLTVRRQIVGRTDLTAAVQNYRYTYRDLLVGDATPTDLDRVDATRTWSASLGYRLGQGTRVGIGMLYRQRQSNSNRFRDYQGFRLISTVDYEL
jgi:hypothetical protein